MKKIKRNKSIILVFMLLSFCKLSSAQYMAWVKNIGGSGECTPNSIQCDKLGNIFVAGQFKDTVDFDLGVGVHSLIAKGIHDGFLAKYDAVGNLIWVNKIGGVNREDVLGLAVDINGDAVITGYLNCDVDFDPSNNDFIISSFNLDDVFIAKYKGGNGGLFWAERLEGNGFDAGVSVGCDKLNNIYIGGNFGFMIDMDPGPGAFNIAHYFNGGRSLFILKLNENGQFIWADEINGPDLVCSKIHVDDSSNVYMAGSFFSYADFDPGSNLLSDTSNGMSDVFVIKVNTNGNLVWAKQFGGIESDYPEGSDIDIQGNIYLTGTFRQTVDFDPNAGVHNLIAYPFSDDIFIVKLDNSGALNWGKAIGSNGMEHGKKLTLDQNGNVYSSGFTYPAFIDFDPGVGVYSFYSEGGYLLKLDSNGNFNWVKGLNEPLTDLKIDSFNNLIMGGTFSGVTSFAMDTINLVTLTAEGMRDGFLMKISPTLNLGIANETSKFSIYPNPSNVSIIIEGDILSSLYNYEIYSTIGQCLIKGQLEHRIDISGLNAGVYYLVLKDDNRKCEILKFLKQ